jgi:hypothetical protein
MKVTYRTGDRIWQIEPALLVVACDPRALEGIMDYTEEERTIFDALQNFTFFTTCVRVQPAKKQDRIVILDALICGLMDGVVHGYRNETAKQWGLDAANRQATNIVTIGQIVRAGATLSEAALLGQLELFLKSPPSWWPFQAGKYEIVSVEERQPPGLPHRAVNPLNTPYFNQFRGTGLAQGRPWQWLDIQGANKTIYVHASTCFESVLHCWSYIQILKETQNVKAALPPIKSAPIVMVGAGVSGLLFANYLKTLGYTNVALLEKSNRYGGKTHSLQVPDERGTTICELGTCYMSPAYDDMIDALSDFTVGNERFKMVGDGADRGMVVRTDHGPEVMSFSDYAMKLACQWLGVPFDEAGKIVVEAALAVATEQYVRLRVDIFGSLNGIMPLKMPQGDPYGIFSKTFAQFLNDNEMGVFKGYLEYAYQIQGYGALDQIPAYYGLVWITPNMAWPWGKTAGVTAWRKGWEDVWEQMVIKLNLRLQLNTEVLAIARTSRDRSAA